MTDPQSLTLTLGGKWHGRYGTAPCPCCQPERRRDQDGLTLSDGARGLLAHCKKAGCSFRDILAAAGITPGTFAPPDAATRREAEAKRKAGLAKRAAQASRLWNEAAPICGTIAEAYLRGRGITCDLPNSLRFHGACWHSSGHHLPAMVARVDGAEAFAVHRTYLRDDGTGKAAADPQKAMLGSVMGGAVRLAEGPVLVVGEGIETALSLASGLLRGPAAIWAALSASGMAGLTLPPTPGKLTIASDGDTAGREAANALATRAHAHGWTVKLLPAPDGRDWNDVLTGRVLA